MVAGDDDLIVRPGPLDDPAPPRAGAGTATRRIALATLPRLLWCKLSGPIDHAENQEGFAMGMLASREERVVA
jgi:hypothetical protein